MKKLILFSAMFCLPFVLLAQTPKTKSVQHVSIDSLATVVNKISSYVGTKYGLEGRYKIYPTENIYNFLKLNTATGQIEQIQWSMDKDKEGVVGIINSEDLSLTNGDACGRFELYPTKNIYTFILVDTWFGFTYHVQWGMKADDRKILFMK